MLSLSQLTKTLKRSDVTSWLISTLSTLGFQTTGWQAGRIQNTMLNMVASATAPFSQVAVELAKCSYSPTSTGPALTLYSRSRFDNERELSEKAAGDFLLTSTATVPYAIKPGQLIVQDDEGTQFGNTEPVNLSAGGTANLDFEALLAGASGNIGNTSRLTLVTPLAGVTVTNPGPGAGVPWYTRRAGRDEELDVELDKRNSTKWGLLGVDRTATALLNLALRQDGVAKAKVRADNPRGPFTVNIYVSGADSLVSTGQIEDAQEAFAYYTMGTEAVWPPTDTPLPSSVRLYHPDTLTLTLQGVVYYDPQFSETDIQSEIQARLDAFVQLIPIGGKTYATGAENLITLGDILEILEGTRGVLSATLTMPAGNVVVAINSLVVPPASWFIGGLDLVPGVNQ